MPSKFAADQLFERMAFDQREEVEDEYGNTVGVWVEQFQRRAEFRHRPGSETVIAGKLEGRSPMEVNLRKDGQTLQITTDWQARDVRRNVAYNIRDVEPDYGRALIRLWVEGGVATG